MVKGLTNSRLRTFAVYHGWYVVAACFLAATVVLGSSQYIFSLFTEPLESEFGWSRTQISASLSFAAIGSLVAPLLGRLMDRRGARLVIVLSLAVTAISFLLRPLMSELWHWYALSFLQFIGFSGAVMLPTGRLIGIWFRQNRGRVMGIAMMGNNFGGLIMPPIAGFAIALGSWQAGYLVVGGVVLAVAMFSLLVVHENAPSTETPEDDIASSRVVLTGLSLYDALHTRVFYVLTFIFMVGSMPFTALLPQMVAHLTNESLSQTSASLALSTIALFGMAGKVSFGVLAERITARYSMIISFSGLTLAIVIIHNPITPWIVWLAAPLFGICMGSFGTLSTLLVQDNFGLRSFGSIVGLLNMATVVTFTVGPLMGGLSFDITESYRFAFLAVAAIMAMGVVAVTQAKSSHSFESI